jgi:hypothetical protein
MGVSTRAENTGGSVFPRLAAWLYVRLDIKTFSLAVESATSDSTNLGPLYKLLVLILPVPPAKIKASVLNWIIHGALISQETIKLMDKQCRATAYTERAIKRLTLSSLCFSLVDWSSVAVYDN